MAKLKERLRHIDEIRAHKQNISLKIQRLTEPYAYALELLQTVPGLSFNHITAISVISEIGADI